MVPAPAPECRQCVLISDFLDFAHLNMREEAALATNWIKDRPEGLKLQNLALATMTGPVLSSSPRNVTADVQCAKNKCESLGTGQQLILHGNPSAHAVTSFLPNVHFQCCMLLQGTLGGDFGIFAASGESTAWVLLWTPRSRPIGVKVCLAAQFNLFSTAFDPREWTMVVFWQQDSGRQPQLITPENGRGDETSSPSPPRFTFFDDPCVPRRPWPPGPPPAPPGSPGPPDPPGLPPGWLPLLQLLVGEKEQELKMYRVSDHVRDLHHRSLNFNPVPVGDGDDDQLPQDGRQRQRSRSRNRVHSCAQAPQAPQVPQSYPRACYCTGRRSRSRESLTISRTIAVS